MTVAFVTPEHEKADLWASFEKSTPSRSAWPLLPYRPYLPNI